MKRTFVFFALVLGLSAAGLQAQSESFDQTTPGALPPGWQAGTTGRGEAKWQVVEDASAPSPKQVLKQSGEATFPWCVKRDVALKEGFVEVRFKPVGGGEDQAGGLVWRFRDGDNYYVARANALEDNVVLYKVENGRRSPLDIKGRRGGYGVGHEVPGKVWTSLRVTFTGQDFALYLNGEKLFEVEDATFQEAGAVGVWTKADSVTLFDDFRWGAQP